MQERVFKVHLLTKHGTRGIASARNPALIKDKQSPGVFQEKTILSGFVNSASVDYWCRYASRASVARITNPDKNDK